MPGTRKSVTLALSATFLCGAWLGCSAESESPGAVGGTSGKGGAGGNGAGSWGSGGVAGSSAGSWGSGGSAGGGIGGSGAGGVGGVGGSSGNGGASGAGGGISCGDLAQQNGWAQAACEWNGNNACNGQGTPTYDCDYCCQVGGSGGSSGSGGGSNGFGYPVGDKSTSPAGGWAVWQVLSHYWSAYSGRHLAQDVSVSGGTGAINAPVYSVADGVVQFAKTNTSSYKNVLLIEHEVGDGSKVCSFYGHINFPIVQAGQSVTRGQQVATVKNWAECVSGGSSSNTHLHYVLLSEALCAKAKNSGSGSGICGYDIGGPNALGRSDTGNEPYYYTSVNDACGSYTVTNGFISPTKFIDAHHF
jgi:murein DD-endopeptidase MepM/ murein hydrolase activator NlpD